MGTVTPAGHDAPTTAAALWADVSRMRETKLVTRRGYTLVGAPVVECAEGKSRENRLWELAALAAGEAVRHARAVGSLVPPQMWAVFWVTATADRPGYRSATRAPRQAAFLQRCGLGGALWREVAGGHAGALAALAESVPLLNSGQVSACLIGGVDSLLQVHIKRWLEQTDRLKTENYTDGLIPGEAAAFVVVEPHDRLRARGGRPLALVTGVGSAKEEATILSDRPLRARGLTDALRAALAAAGIGPDAIRAVFCDLNGESYRGREWGMAGVRVGFPDSVDVIHPADCIGDVGAAAGALLLGYAAMRFDGGPHPQSVLVFAGSETGERGAAVLASPGPTPIRAGQGGGTPAVAAPPPGPVPPVVEEIVREHFEEFQVLWAQRQVALRSPDYNLRNLERLDTRIKAHLRGLRVAGERAGPLIEEALAGDDPGAVFAAAHLLLSRDPEGSGRRVGELTASSEGPKLDGLRQALCQVPLGGARTVLKTLLTAAIPAVAMAAAEVLAAHRGGEVENWRPEKFATHDDPAVRRAIWRVVALGVSCLPQAYAAGFREPDPTVRREALAAAAWSRHPALADHCRAHVRQPSAASEPEAQLLAVIGRPEDLNRIVAVGEEAGLGPRRFNILGAFGHPGVVDLLLAGMVSPDPRTAAAAGQAFTRITGADVESQRRVELPPEDGHEPDEVEREFLDEAFLPDPAKARAFWDRASSHFQKGTRWCRGLDLSGPGGPEVWDNLDLESRWEAYLRGKFEGTWPGSLADLERFPHGAPPPAAPPPVPRPEGPPSVPEQRPSAPPAPPPPPAASIAPPAAVSPPSAPSARGQLPQQAAPFQLEILSGARAGEFIPVKLGSTLYVGRHESMHLCLEDDKLSDAHFSLECSARGCRMRDLGSRTGTFVNGQKTYDEAVRPGDRIEAGQSSFVLRGPADS